MAAREITDSSAYVAPDYTEGKLYDLTTEQYAWLASWALMAITIAFAASQLWIKVLAVLFFAVGVIGALTYNEGAGYQVFADRRESRAMVKRGRDHTDGTVRPGENQWIGLSLVGIPLGTESADGRCAQETGHIFPTGFIVNKDLSRIAFVIRYGGSKRPSMDWDHRMGAEQSIIDVFAQAFAAIGYELERPSLGHSIAARPCDIQPTLDVLANQTLHPDFVDPSPDSIEAAMAANTDIRLRKMAMVGNNNSNTFTVTVDLPPVWAEQIRSGTPLESLDDSSIFMLVSHITDGLRESGLNDVTCLNLLELDEWVRIVRTIKGAGKLHDDLYVRRLRFAALTLEQAITELIEDPPWPRKFMKLGPDYLYMDGSYFRIWRTTNYGGLKRFRPGGMVGLQMPSGARWNTTSIIGRIVAADTEEKRLTRSIVWQTALRDEAKERGRYLSERDRDNRRRPQDQQTLLYRMGAPVFKYNRLVVAGAPNHRMLRIYSAITVAVHLRRLIKLRKIELPVRQIRSFTSAILGLDM